MQLPKAIIPEMRPNISALTNTLDSSPNEGIGPPLTGRSYDDVPDLSVLFEPLTSNGSKILRLVSFVLGCLFAAYGAVGTFVPVLPGFPFLVLGLIMMATSSERARRWANRFERRLPLKTRLKLRKYKPTLPPKGATPAQMRYWRRKTALSALMFTGSVAFFSGIGLGTTWLIKSFL